MKITDKIRRFLQRGKIKKDESSNQKTHLKTPTPPPTSSFERGRGVDPPRRYLAEMSGEQRRRALVAGLPAFPQSSGFTYIIFKSGEEVFAIESDSGKIQYSSPDAATVFQNVLDAMSSGGVIFVGPGTYSIDTMLTFNDNTVIRGSGKENTILKTSNSSSNNLIWMKNYCGLSDLTLDGNDANQTDGGDLDQQNCIRYMGSNCFLLNVRVKNAYYRLANFGSYNTIIACEFIQTNRAYGTRLYGEDYTQIVGCFFDMNNKDASAIMIENAGKHNSINGNYFTRCGHTAIYVADNSAFNSVTGNTFYNNRSDIQFHKDSSYNVAVGNTIERDDGSPIYDGILIRKADHCVAIGNVIKGQRHGINIYAGDNSGDVCKYITIADNIINGCDRVGIIADGAANTTLQHLNITNNTVHNCGQESGTTYQGILITNRASKVKVLNNVVIDDQGTATTHRGIETNSDDTEVEFNRIAGATSGNIVITGSRVKVRYNAGYLTEVEGTTTILSGNTSITVDLSGQIVNVSGSPTGVIVTPITDLYSSTKFFVSSLTSGSFDINVDADPNEDVVFAYRAFYKP